MLTKEASPQTSSTNLCHAEAGSISPHLCQSEPVEDPNNPSHQNKPYLRIEKHTLGYPWSGHFTKANLGSLFSLYNKV